MNIFVQREISFLLFFHFQYFTYTFKREFYIFFARVNVTLLYDDAGSNIALNYDY